MLKAILKKIAWAGKSLSSSILPAPKFWDTIAEIALRLWARIQMSIERKDPTIPTAASDSVPYSGILPTTAASVLESTGSAMPDSIAGIASC